MKRRVSRLKRGEILSGRVSEIQAEGFLIVNIDGDLLRARNQTSHKYSVGDLLDLVVICADPLAFQVHSAGQGTWSRFV